MSDHQQIPPQPPPQDAYGAKAHFDVNQQKLHAEGPPGALRQITDLLILVAIIAGVIFLIRLFW